MSLQEHLEEMQKIQENLLIFLEEDKVDDDNFFILIQLLDELNFHSDQYKLTSFLRMLVKISNNHHHNTDFYNKIEQILVIFINDIKNFYSNFEIFHIFKRNKRILLFITEKNIMKIDKYVVKNITTPKFIKAKYPQYFQSEIKPFINEKWFPRKYPNEWINDINKELPEHFYENRKKGENENYICQLIREDSVVEFIAYVNKTNYPLESKINPSIYETNQFLIKKQNEKLTLIEYAAFFGSIQILKYMLFNGVELKPSLWIFAIHGQNNDIVHLLEENNDTIHDKNKHFNECFLESIKCHHNDIARYIQSNILCQKDESLKDTLAQSLKYYNFAFIHNEFLDRYSFVDACRYGHYSIAKFFLNNKDTYYNIINIKLFR